MDELSLQELKDIEFNLLKEFRAFCNENGIRFFLAYGTLLGAIRYKGFIPWDDDIDVLVPREDYNKLIRIFRDSDKYRLYSFERNQKYGYPFAKLCDMSTRKIEFYFEPLVDYGVDIDIFPLDYWDDDIEKAKKEVVKIQRNMFWLDYSKYSSPTIKKPVKRFIQRILITACKILGHGYFIRKITAESMNNPNGRAYAGAKSWCVYGERGICPAEAFSEAIEIEFEGEKFPAPIDYDTYLTCLYGDYLPEPPKEKQKTHHLFNAYRITEEDRV